MSPIAACVISPNYEYFKVLMDRETNKDPNAIQIEDLTIANRMYSFVHYLCKKHRLTHGENEDIKSIFGYLRSIGFVVKNEEDKKSLFRQLVMSWALDPSQADLKQIWKDFFGLIKFDEQKVVFDLYKGRDLRENNMRLIVGKNTDKKVFSFVLKNIETYCDS